MSMWIAYILAFLLAIATGTAYELSTHARSAIETSQAAQTGTNVGLLANQLDKYVLAHPAATGVVPAASLGLPAWYKMYPGLASYVDAGAAYVYMPATTGNDPVAYLRDIAGPGVTAGIKTGNAVKDGTGRQVATLAGSPATAIGDNAMVLVVRQHDSIVPPITPPTNTPPVAPPDIPPMSPVGPPIVFGPLPPGSQVPWNPSTPSPPPAPLPPPSCDTTVTGHGNFGLCGKIGLDGIPSNISDYSAVGANASLSFNANGTWSTKKTPLMSGAWLTVAGTPAFGLAAQFEIKVDANTTWMTKICQDMGGAYRCDTYIPGQEVTTHGWTNMGTGVTISVGNTSCQSTSESDTGTSSESQAKLTIRSVANNEKTWTLNLHFEACGACFAAGTEVQKADGTWTKIETLRLGDKIRSFTSPGVDFANGDIERWQANDMSQIKFTAGVVENVHPFERDGGVSLNGIKSTAGHVYLGHAREGYRFLSANRFTMSDELVGEDNVDSP
ncbi:type IV pilus biogenesis protein PilM [Rhodanobacter soli]